MDSGTMLWPGLISVLSVVDSSSPHEMHKPCARISILSKKPNRADRQRMCSILGRFMHYQALLQQY